MIGRLRAFSAVYGQQLFNVGLTALTMMLSAQVVRAKLAKNDVEAELDATRAELERLRELTTVDGVRPVATVLAVDARSLCDALANHLRPAMKAEAPKMV